MVSRLLSTNTTTYFMKTSIIALGLFISSLLATAETPGAPKSAKLIVYRKGCIYGSMARYKVVEDGKELASLKNNSMYTAELTPGSHTISAKQPKRSVTINVQEGQTYVVKYKTRFGIFGARPKLEVTTLEAAKKDTKLVDMPSMTM